MATEINEPLLRKMVEWVEEQDAHPETTREWWQRRYLLSEPRRVMYYQHETGCGTAYCIAGKIAATLDPAYEKDEWGATRGTSFLVHASRIAREELGLTDVQADRLFHAENSAPRIRQLAEEFVGHAL